MLDNRQDLGREAVDVNRMRPTIGDGDPLTENGNAVGSAVMVASQSGSR
ncbi:MAG: hypothetical protein ACC645_14915 [Pirellulales bacterium]